MKATAALVLAEKSSTAVKVAIASVLLAGLLLTAIVYKLVSVSHSEQAVQALEQQATDATSALSSTLTINTNLLLALQGLFHASDAVSRLEFNLYLESIDSKNQFPGAAALSWNALVQSGDINAFEANVRSDTSLQASGYPQFSIRPVVTTDSAVIVTYIEPMIGNESAFGFDIASNPARLAAVEQARDTGLAVATPPNTLEQETGSQKSFMMMLPTYSQQKLVNQAARESAFTGLVVAEFRAGDLIEASAKPEFTFFEVRDVTDNDAAEDEQMLYSAGTAMSSGDYLSSERTIEFAGRSWLISFQQNQESRKTGEQLIEWLIAGLGGLVSLLAATLFGAVLTSRQRAVTAAKKLTVDLQKANDELSRSNADLSQFAHVASHDLQTPVRNVISSVTLLEEHLGDSIDPDVEELFGFLRKSATRMRTLVTDLLEYARLGRDAITFAPIDLNQLMLEVRASTASLCASTGAQFRTDDLPQLVGDRKQLLCVFENLVVNAIKYSDEARSPVIVVEHRNILKASGRSGGTTNGKVQVAVSDNGQGIKDDFHEAVFIPFRRLHRHDEIEGTGLGLGICKQIVERHGGSIEIESSSDQGTTFLITLLDHAPSESSK